MTLDIYLRGRILGYVVAIVKWILIFFKIQKEIYICWMFNNYCSINRTPVNNISLREIQFNKPISYRFLLIIKMISWSCKIIFDLFSLWIIQKLINIHRPFPFYFDEENILLTIVLTNPSSIRENIYHYFR